MLKLNRKVEYGLMAVRYLHRQPADALASAREIADAHQAPYDLMAKVLQQLHRRRLIESVQGAHGGYRLAGQNGEVLQTISLAEFIECLDGPLALTDCLHPEEPKTPCVRHEECGLRSPLGVVNGRVQAILAQTTLAEIAD